MTLPRGVHLADPSDAYYYHFSPCTGWRCIVLDAFDVAVHDGRIAGKPRSQTINARDVSSNALLRVLAHCVRASLLHTIVHLCRLHALNLF